MSTPTTHGKVPEALRLANVCSNLTRYSMDAHLIAAELRRMYAENVTLRQGYDAARLEIDHLRGATKMIEQSANEYPPLPMHYHVVYDDIDDEEVNCFTSNQMRAYVDADRATRT